MLRLRALAVLVALALASAAPSRAEDEAPPEPVFVDFDGKYVRASDHRGKVVLLNFWATWCPPCRQEMPALVKLADELGPKGLKIIGPAANGRDEGEAVRRSMREMNVNFEVWLWVSAKDMKWYGVGPSLPGTAVIDRSGKVRKSIRGVVDEKSLKPLLEELLAEPAPSVAE